MTTSHPYDHDLGEAVEVTLTGRVIERKDTPSGDQYWVEQTLPDGRTARQWFRGCNIRLADDEPAGPVES